MKKLATIITIVTLIASGNISIINASAKDIEKNNDNVQLESNYNADEKNVNIIEDAPSTDPFIIDYDQKMATLIKEFKNSTGIKQALLEKKISRLHKGYEDHVGDIKVEKGSEEGKSTTSDFPVLDDPLYENWNYYGDVVVTKGFSSSLIYAGHALIVDIDKEWYVESCLKNFCDGAPVSGVQYRLGYTKNVVSHNRNNWGRFNVRGATVSQYRNALGFAQNKVGQPYNMSFNHGGVGYYCSELVAYAWQTSRINIISDYSLDNIFPIELAWSNNTIRVDGNLW